MKKKTQVPKWLHRVYIFGTLFFLVLCVLSLWARNWWVAAGMGAWAVIQLGLWLTTEPKGTGGVRDQNGNGPSV